MGLEVGVDIGGTFTDFVAVDEGKGTIRSLKTPTVPAAPEVGIVHGLRGLTKEGVRPEEITYFVHGTTIATNTLIQRSGARLALLVTEGFRDVLELARIRLLDPFDFNSGRPTPLIPRERVLPVRERVRADGTIDVPLDSESARQAIRRALDTQVEGIAVCLLNSYRNPTHELEIRQLVREMAPELHVSCSCEVWPEIREYERSLVTVINAFVRPGVVSYLGRLSATLREEGLGARPYVTKSNGGIMGVGAAVEAPVEMLLSGPAAGVTGATAMASLAGITRIITFDMGGTSADVAIVTGGEPEYSRDSHVGDFPVIIPVIGVSSVGAGGGSVAWCDRSGVLRVGPRSVGADPGPACYDRGGEEPAVTDAFVVTGLLDPDSFSGGRLRLSRGRAESAIARLGGQLGLRVAEAAEAIIAVAKAAMFVEFSALLTRKGLDPREFTLVAFGGAGPLVACSLAQECHIGRVLVPPEPGTLCALGALMADVRNDYIKTVHARLSDTRPETLERDYRSLRRQAEEWLRGEPLRLAEWRIEYTADMRYVGQAYEIQVAVSDNDLRGMTLDALAQRFHARHKQMYGHADAVSPCEIVNLRARLIGRRQRVVPQRIGSAVGEPRAIRRQTVRADGQVFNADVYRRSELRAGHALAGPAVVEQADTTVFVPAGFGGSVDEWGNLLIRRSR